MAEIQDLLEQIINDTVNASDEVPSDIEMEEFSQIPAAEFMEHAYSYVERWLDSYTLSHSKLSEAALVALYMSGFITGRLYEERRRKVGVGLL